MKRIVLFISFIFIASLCYCDVIISQYYEGASNNKWIEVTNVGDAVVDLTDYYIARWSGTDTPSGSPTNFSKLSDIGITSIAVGEVILFQNSSAVLPSYATGTHTTATYFNGDDPVALTSGTNDWSDRVDCIYGSIAKSKWGDETSFYRKSSVLTGNLNMSVLDGTGEWLEVTITNVDNAAPGTTERLGVHTFGGNALPFITNIARTPAGDITSSTTVSISADVTDSDGTISLVALHWGLASGSLTYTINMSNSGGDTYTTNSDIPAQSDLTTVYYEIYAEDNVPESSTSAKQSYTVFDAQSTTLPYTEPFDADLGICYTYSDSGSTKYWIWDDFDMNGFAYMSGYNSGETEEDWLILPAIDFDSYANETITFDTWYNYGTDNATNYLKLYYSADYPGLGDPSGYTWTELAFTHPGASQTWASSGIVDLSAISGTSVYIAFKYRYEVSMYRNWEVDNLSIIEGNPPLVADFEADQTNVTPGTTVNFTDLTTGGATPYSYAWDLDADGQYDDEFVANPAVEFPTIGTYTIALKVTDDDSNEDIEIKVDYIVVAEISEDIMINEIDSDTPGTDALEFIELYDGGAGNTPLDGYVVVLYNGSTTDASYDAFDLDTYSTTANGYFVIGSASVPNVDLVEFTTNGLQNGPDAVALYIGDATDFPNGTAVTTVNLVDAIVYDTSDADDPELLVLLNAGEPQVNENGNGNKDTESCQRIPNGSGGLRNTSTYAQALPTPGAVNQAAPPVPVDLIITVNGADIDLNWTASAGATGYNIFRSTDPYNFGTTAHDTSVTNSYTDVGAASGVKYFYMVTATN